MRGTASGKPCPRSRSLGALNGWLEERCRELWGQTRHGGEPGMIADVWAHEVKSLPCVWTGYSMGSWKSTKRVSSVSPIHLERNRYSVPAWFASPTDRSACGSIPTSLWSRRKAMSSASTRAFIDRTHNGPGRTVYDWRHYLAVIQRKPGALRNGAPFLELPEAFKRLQHHLLRHIGGDREMVEILALVLHHDEQAVLVAVELALEDGVPSQDPHILNRLHRLIDGKPAALRRWSLPRRPWP